MNKQYEARRTRLREHLLPPLKKKKKQQHIDKQWKQYQKLFIKLVKSTSEIEYLNLDNVLKSTIFTGSEFQAFMTRSPKKFPPHIPPNNSPDSSWAS